MFFDFDLQMFAEEAEQTIDNTEVATETVEGEQEEEKEPIPEELGGLPEDAAREVMAEAEKLQQAEEEPKEDTGEVSKAEEESIVKKEAIPYARFKQKVDESNALKAELESYKAKYGDLNAQPALQPQQSQPAQMKPVQYQQAPQEMPPLNLTPDVVKQIDELKKQEALRMTGLSQEDLDGMEYMEETDPRKQQYQFALKMAENNIVSRIQQARVEQARQAEAFMQAHNASVADYNAFAQKEMAAPDFQQVMKFATEDYFTQKSPAEQQTIANAYVRVERNTASPAEVMLVKNYFTEAKNAFHGQKGKPKANPMAKAQQAASFPRSQQVEGTSDNDTGVSVATLEKLLAEKPWDEIPEKYQKMLMGE
jgi:hypothetical protein